MPNNRGNSSTQSILAKRQVIDMSETIHMLNASENPFTTVLKSMSKGAAAENYKFEWIQDHLLGQSTLLDMVAGLPAVADGATQNVDLDVTDIYKPQDVVRFMYGDNLFSDIMLVTNINSATQIQVRRGVAVLNGEGGTTQPVTIPDNSICFVLGNAFEEGSLSAVILNTEMNPYYNYTQHFKTSFGVTGRGKVIKVYGQPELDWQRKKKGIEHMREQELSFIFGERSKFVDAGGELTTTTQGLWHWNTKASHGGIATPNVLTESEFDDFVEELFVDNLDESKRVKNLFAGSKIMSAVTSWAKPYVRIKPSDKTWGLDITEYVTPFGKLNLIYHPKVFDLPQFSNLGIGVDFNSMKYKALTGRDTKLKTNIQANDQDAQKDQYDTDAGIEVTTPEVNCNLIIDRT